MHFLIFLEHRPKVGHIIFKISSLISILPVEVGVPLFIFDFFLDVFLVESNHSFLELLEVGDMVEAFEHIVFEFLFVALLLIELLSQVVDLVRESFLSHPEVVDDQSQVLVDPVEMFELLSHFVRLLIQFLNFQLSRSDISFQFLDFVIQHEFEFFKLLSFFLKIVDSFIFVLDGGLSFLKLPLL
jgi:hypothetical protein